MNAPEKPHVPRITMAEPIDGTGDSAVEIVDELIRLGDAAKRRGWRIAPDTQRVEEQCQYCVWGMVAGRSGEPIKCLNCNGRGFVSVLFPIAKTGGR